MVRRARSLAPVRACATPVLDGVGPLPFAALGAIHMDPVDPMPSLEAHTLLAELTEETVTTLVDLAGPAVHQVRRLADVLGRHGVVERFDTWVPAGGHWTYQWVLLRTAPV